MPLEAFLAKLLPLIGDENTSRLLQSLALVVGAGWVLWSFRKSNRTKAIETLISLESEFRQHIALLTRIEERDSAIITALKNESANRVAAANHKPLTPLTNQEHRTIADIDKLLRHMLICHQTKKFGIDGGALDSMYKYYLTVLCSNEQSELSEYINVYYKDLFDWSRRLNNPWYGELFQHK
jgi:hypothetical protein